MAKKTRQEKELSRLRQQLEVLKAQQSNREFTPSPSYSPSLPVTSPEKSSDAKPETKPLSKNLEKAGIQRVDQKFIKKDLLKTALLSLAALLLIAIIYLLRNQIPFL